MRIQILEYRTRIERDLARCNYADGPTAGQDEDDFRHRYVRWRRHRLLPRKRLSSGRGRSEPASGGAHQPSVCRATRVGPIDLSPCRDILEGRAGRTYIEWRRPRSKLDTVFARAESAAD